MSVFNTLFEEFNCKASNSKALAILLCDLTEKIGGGCDSCPAQKYCENNVKGWDVLLEKNPDELWRR